MAKTDHPLKEAFLKWSRDFTSWVMEKEVLEATPVPTELLPEEYHSIPDLIFRVKKADQSSGLIVIELQGRKTKVPMPMRVLLSATRLGRNNPNESITSYVIYVERWAGSDDTGHHTISQEDGTPAINWHYKVIWLWKMTPAELLALAKKLGSPALLVLIGLTRLTKDAIAVMKEAIAYIKAMVSDKAEQMELVARMYTLIQDPEVITMTEQMIEADEDLYMNSPFLHWVRDKYWAKEFEERTQEMVQEAVQEAVQEVEQRVEEERQRAHQMAVKLAQVLLTLLDDEAICVRTGLTVTEVQALRTHR